MTEQVDLLEEAKRNFPYIVTHLLGEPNKRMSRGRHDTRYGRKGSLSIDFDRCLFSSFENKQGGGVYEFLKTALNTDDTKEVTTWLKDFLRRDDLPPPPPRNEIRNPNSAYTQGSPQTKTQNKKYALDTWNNSIEVKGTPVEKYLLGRGINIQTILKCNDIRFYNCKLPGNAEAGKVYPAMISLYRDITTNEPVAIHRTYLDIISPDKIVTKQKANLGSNKNAVIKLSDEADVYDTLFITEGIENGLTALLKGFSPVWATGDAGSVSKFKPILGINNLIIFADNDKAGLESAENCRELWKGRNIQIFKSPRGDGDLNDLVKESLDD